MGWVRHILVASAVGACTPAAVSVGAREGVDDPATVRVSGMVRFRDGVGAAGVPIGAGGPRTWHRVGGTAEDGSYAVDVPSDVLVTPLEWETKPGTRSARAQGRSDADFILEEDCLVHVAPMPGRTGRASVLVDHVPLAELDFAAGAVIRLPCRAREVGISGPAGVGRGRVDEGELTMSLAPARTLRVQLHPPLGEGDDGLYVRAGGGAGWTVDGAVELSVSGAPEEALVITEAGLSTTVLRRFVWSPDHTWSSEGDVDTLAVDLPTARRVDVRCAPEDERACSQLVLGSCRTLVLRMLVRGDVRGDCRRQGSGQVCTCSTASVLMFNFGEVFWLSTDENEVTVDLPSAAGNVDVLAAPGARVRLESGAWWWRPVGHARTGLADSQGRVAFVQLPDGPWIVRAGDRKATVSVAGGTTRVDLRPVPLP